MKLPFALGSLASLLERNQAKVLLVVGAGVSVGATDKKQASWFGLLNHGIEYLVSSCMFTAEFGATLKEKLVAAFNPFNLQNALQVAGLIQQSLESVGPEPFRKWLSDAFSDLVALPGRMATLNALRDLQQTGALIITTNYDSLLSLATGTEPITWEDKNFLRLITGRQKGIFHLHGYWRKPSSVVLSPKDYDRIVGQENFQSAFKSLS
jgi:NAD-dependent SIR2 family protein deacetylase